MAIENSVSIDFYLHSFADSVNVFDCRISGVISGKGEQFGCSILFDCIGKQKYAHMTK